MRGAASLKFSRDLTSVRIPGMNTAIVSRIDTWVDAGETVVILGDSDIRRTHLLIDLGIVTASAVPSPPRGKERVEADDDKNALRKPAAAVVSSTCTALTREAVCTPISVAADQTREPEQDL
ncbi:hypothetical protein FDG2_6137 [Candidatus Protofrankia californiensis]|uniref:Uncharacterized protein n=1 Tax=Candidatus Protofrankia californiensis TaxID=1839754 RepID=A0A1C3PGC8_9ACTN|nr:hypothetical protein FDG2_6137 [Candidatus Protofrankia californiensis]